MYRSFVKGVIDFLLSIILLVVLSPLILLIMILLSIAFRGNPFFVQQRPGQHESKFYLIKFKTMNDEKDSEGNLLPDPERLTTLGKLIRKTSMDELPQLLNVLKGDMSFVGPRPLLMEYLPLYNEQQKKRHLVKPGITGWAQVNGRNQISWEDKFEMDVWYVEHVSFLLDMKIFLLTIIKVFKSEGINSKTSATMEKFKGSE